MSPARPTFPLAVLTRATASGAVAGAAIGGIAATFGFPVVGTFIGALVGAPIGAAVGFGTGIICIAIIALTSSRTAVQAAGGLPSAVGVSALPLGLHRGWGEPLLLFSCALVAGALAPFTAYGTQRLPLGRRLPFGHRLTTSTLRKIVTGVVTAGAAVGSVAGLVIGIWTYLPTFPFAIIEGGLLGAVSGLVVAIVLVAVLVCVATLTAQ